MHLIASLMPQGFLYVLDCSSDSSICISFPHTFGQLVQPGKTVAGRIRSFFSSTQIAERHPWRFEETVRSVRRGPQLPRCRAAGGPVNGPMVLGPSDLQGR